MTPYQKRFFSSSNAQAISFPAVQRVQVTGNFFCFGRRINQAPFSTRNVPLTSQRLPIPLSPIDEFEMEVCQAADTVFTQIFNDNVEH